MNVTAMQLFADGGFKDTPPFVLPARPSLLQRLPALILGEAFVEVNKGMGTGALACLISLHAVHRTSLTSLQ